jgi:hypothetical protein
LEGALDISADEVGRPEDGAIHVAFRSKMEDRARAMLIENVAEMCAIDNVTANKLVTRVTLDGCKVLQISGIGQLVQNHHRGSTLCQPLQDKIGTNKTGSAGYHNMRVQRRSFEAS